MWKLTLILQFYWAIVYTAEYHWLLYFYSRMAPILCVETSEYTLFESEVCKHFNIRFYVVRVFNRWFASLCGLSMNQMVFFSRGKHKGDFFFFKARFGMNFPNYPIIPGTWCRHFCCLDQAYPWFFFLLSVFTPQWYIYIFFFLGGGLF